MNKEKNTHLIHKELNKNLNNLSVTQERILYLIIKKVKESSYNSSCFDVLGKFDGENTKNKITITGKEIRKLLKYSLKDIIQIIKTIPNSVKVEYDNGDIDCLYLFKRMRYKKDSDIFEIYLNVEEFNCFVIMYGGSNNFFKIYHEEFMKLTSKWSQNLYRLCSQWFEYGKTFNITIEHLKEVLGVLETYNTKNLEYKILKPAIENINKNTNFNITYLKKKKKGKIVGFRFRFKRNYFIGGK